MSAPRHRSAGLLLVLLFVLFSFAGCRKRELAAAEIRAMTREMASAAQKAIERLPGRAEITLWPEMRPLASKLGDSGQAAGQPARELVTDHIYITLPDPTGTSALENELDRVARRHGLARDPAAAGPVAPGVVRFGYRFGDRRTQVIHIILPVARRSARGEPAPLPRGRRGDSSGAGVGPQVAIIIDDLGYDRAAADALFSLPFPLTVSVLPHLPFSTEIAEEAHRRGYQVILHLPMESTNEGAKPEAIELRAGMTREEITQILAGMLATVPHAAGANNHQGSLATADPNLMAALMPVLRDRGLFFIDSRTTTATVAYDVARRAGLPAAYRNVFFLDDTPAREAVLNELTLAERQAQLQGWAIAIGHPRPATLQALEEFLPQLEARGSSRAGSRGTRLVYASQLVH